MKRIGTILSVSLLVVGLAALAYSWGGPGFPGRGPGFGGMCFDVRLIPDLNLTPEQNTKLEALRLEHLKEIKPLEDRMFSLSGELRLLWQERVPDEVKINAVQKELRAVRDQLWDKTTAYLLKVKGILTPEQQQKLSTARWMSGTRMSIGKRGPRGWNDPWVGQPPFGPGPCWR